MPPADARRPPWKPKNEHIGEILGRTEEYFCPIKHAHKILGTHGRYNRFLDYGDAERSEARLEEFRVGLGKVRDRPVGPR